MMYVYAHVVYVCVYVCDRVCVYMCGVCVCTLTRSHQGQSPMNGAVPAALTEEIYLLESPNKRGATFLPL